MSQVTRDSQGMILLVGDEQTGEFAQLLLDSTPEKNLERQRQREEKERRRREAQPKLTPEQEAKIWSEFAVPLITDALTTDTMPDLLAVQTMATPAGESVAFLKCEAIGADEPLRGRPPAPACGPDEEVHQYWYGGILSERGGWFVTPKGDMTRVLRYRMDWLS